MTFKRFQQLWNALVRDVPRTNPTNPITTDSGDTTSTAGALVSYDKGDKNKTKTIQEKLQDELDWKAIAQWLYNVLDDIGSASDHARDNNIKYRECVERLQRLKNEVGASFDGQTVVFRDPGEEYGFTRLWHPCIPRPWDSELPLSGIQPSPISEQLIKENFRGTPSKTGEVKPPMPEWFGRGGSRRLPVQTSSNCLEVEVPTSELPMTELPDGSGCFTSTVMSEEEAMTLPVEQRPLAFRISSEMYHDVFEAIGEASTTWKSECGNEVFDSEKAADIATRLCFKIAKEIERKVATK